MTPDFAINSILSERNPQTWDWNDQLLETSLIERVKKRNYRIAVATATIVTITAVATLIFSLTYVIAVSPVYMTAAIIARSLGVPILLYGLPIGVWAGVNYLLHIKTVEPLQRYKDLRSENLLLDLVKRCDEKALKTLIPKMSFQQLRSIQSILSRKTFKEYIHNVNRIWELILSFEEMNSREQCEFIRNNQEFGAIVKNLEKAALCIHQMIFKKNDPQVIEAYNEKFIDGEKIVIGKMTYSKAWVESECRRIDNSEELSECLDILRGVTDLPKDVKRLAEISLKYGINRLTTILVNVMIRTAESQVELYAWIAQNLMDYEFAHIRINFNDGTLDSFDEMKFLWPFREDWSFINTICLRFFDQQLEVDFRAAYEMAYSLDSADLKVKCFEYIKRASEEEKVKIQSSYQNDEPIPKELLNLI